MKQKWIFLRSKIPVEKYLFLFLLVLVSAALPSCKTTGILSSGNLRLYDYCNSIDSIPTDTSCIVMMPADIQATGFYNRLASVLSVHDFIIAEATGTLSILQQSDFDCRDSFVEKQGFCLSVRERFEKRIILVEAQLGRITTKVQCEMERMSRIASYLDNLNKKKINHLTVSAIIAGALTTVAPVIFSNTATQNAVTIGGGAGTTILGLWLLHPGGKKVKITLPNNILEDIWFRPTQSPTYPPFLWKLLNSKAFNPSTGVSFLGDIKRRWEKFTFGGSLTERGVSLFFREGGLYSEDDLNTRVELLGHLSAVLHLVQSDLESYRTKAMLMMGATCR